MAQFYAEIQGNRGNATRMGTKSSGISGHIRGWHIGGEVSMRYDKENDRDEVTIYVTSGSSGSGRSECLGTFHKDKDGNFIKA